MSVIKMKKIQPVSLNSKDHQAKKCSWNHELVLIYKVLLGDITTSTDISNSYAVCSLGNMALQILF